jgi:hypothetical protein
MMNHSVLLLVVVSALVMATATAFAPISITHGDSLTLTLQPSSRRSVALFAGFGGGEKPSKQKDKKKKTPKETKLKPKSQWDRYLDMKGENKIRVAVQCTDSEEWLEVGRVRSKDSANTAIAVARQRALIAEVRKHKTMQCYATICNAMLFYIGIGYVWLRYGWTTPRSQ